jgi:hypothetical protein
MKTSTLRRLHRWIGLACALTVLAASGSGILHTVMTWTQPPPPRPQPVAAIDAAALRIAPADALARLGPAARPVRSLLLCMIGGQPWYQVLAGDSLVPRYLSAVDGHEDAAQDNAYAAEIATRHLGGQSVKWTRRLDAYDGEYLTIFRLLPVHQLEADDDAHTRLYVSTLTGSVARHTDDSRQLEANIFSLVHKYGFISSKPWRDGLLVGFTALAFFTSLVGIALFFVTRRPRITTTSS